MARKEELDGWGWPAEMRKSFLEMQFKAQQGYRAMFPEADFQIIERDGQRVGQLIIDRAAEEIRLVDIALLPEQRGAGLGAAAGLALLLARRAKFSVPSG